MRQQEEHEWCGRNRGGRADGKGVDTPTIVAVLQLAVRALVGELDAANWDTDRL